MVVLILVILTVVALKRGWGGWVALPLAIFGVLEIGCGMLFVTREQVIEEMDNPIGAIWGSWNDFGFVDALGILTLSIMAIVGRKKS